MKKLLFTLAAVALLALGAMPVSAQEKGYFDGKWELKFDNSQLPDTANVVVEFFRTDAGELDAKFSKGILPGSEAPKVTKVDAKEHVVMFFFPIEYNGQDMEVFIELFKDDNDSDKVTGTVADQFAISGKRLKQ